MKRTIMVLMLLLAAVVASAQEATPPAVYSQYFGMAAGFVTGYGISYRNWPDAWGFQITGTPVVSAGSTLFDLGINGLCRLNDSQWTRFFLYFGGQGFYSTSTSINFDGTSLNTSTYGITGGGGIGLELIFFDHIVWDIQGGIQTSFGSDGFKLGPSGESGVYYRL